MRRWMIALPAVLMGCGMGNVGGPEDSPVVLPQALKAACGSARPAASSPICFSGVDYSDFPHGAIYQAQSDGTVSTLYRRAADYLTSYAQAPDGTVYFTNALNGTALYRIDGAGESVVYRHDTYVRMVRIDSKGQVYFNEESGAGGDGTIYKLVDGVPEVFYRVRLSSVAKHSVARAVRDLMGLTKPPGARAGCQGWGSRRVTGTSCSWQDRADLRVPAMPWVRASRT